MPKSALIYAWCVVAAGAAIAIASALLWRTQPAGSSDAPAFWVCLALAGLASTFKVKLPGFD